MRIVNEWKITDETLLSSVHVIKRGDEQRDIQYSEDKVGAPAYKHLSSSRDSN